MIKKQISGKQNVHIHSVAKVKKILADTEVQKRDECESGVCENDYVVTPKACVNTAACNALTPLLVTWCSPPPSPVFPRRSP